MQKMLKRIKKILILGLPLVLLLSVNVYADSAIDYLSKLESIYKDISIYAVALIPVSAIVIAIMYMATPLNLKNKDNAKDALYALVVGVFLLAASPVITYTIMNLLGLDLNSLKDKLSASGYKKVSSVTYANGDIVKSNGEVILGSSKETSTSGPTTLSSVDLPAANPTIGGSKGDAVVAYAKQFLGCKYVRAAAGPTTFDCSGLVLYVYKHFGYTLPHFAASQYTMGTAVDRFGLQPGDLVFFNTGAPLGHVGIYIGNGQFIEAPKPGGVVQITSMSDSYYSTRYAGARRILPSIK